MIGFGQVDELEVESEGACEQYGALYGERVDQLESFGSVASGFSIVAASLSVAPPDRALAQSLDMRKEVFASLLAQHFAEQSAERTNVAAQGRFLQITGARFQLRQPLRPAFGVPQEGHSELIMHDWM